MGNAIFRSTTDRFNESYASNNPNVRILRNKSGPRNKIVAQSEQGKVVYDKDALYGVEN